LTIFKPIFLLTIALLVSAKLHAWVAFVAPDGAREKNVFNELRAEIKKIAPGILTELRFLSVTYDSNSNIASQIKVQIISQPQIIIAASAAISLEVKIAYPAIPLIFASQQDPIAIGLVDSLDKRKTKATGFTSFLPVHRKQLQLLHAFDTKIKTVGIIADRGWRDTPGVYEDIVQTSARLKIKPVVLVVNRTDDLSKALSTKEAGKVDAWFIPATPAVVDRIDETIKIINQRAKPAIFGLTEFAKRGGLMAYQAKLDPPTKIWAQMIVSILAGTPIESIPIDRPRHFELSLNIKTLRLQSLVVPSRVRDQVTKTFN
jgi:putative tryptophan/tyrosine transport system substrate-binding protein